MKDDSMKELQIDWNREWARRLNDLNEPTGSEYWDGRADSFRPGEGSDYAAAFISEARLLPGESVLDMGCGAGTLSVPLACSGHQVTAVDFSPRMLAALKEEASAKGVGERVRTIRAAWDDDWDEAGIPIADVSFSSRSLASPDLGRSLRLLESHARRQVCVTLSTESSPRYDPILYGAVGRRRDPMPEYVFVMNLLMQRHRHPRLSYLVSRQSKSFPTYELACENIRFSLFGVRDGERDAYEKYCREHIKRTADGSGWARDYPTTIRWAFISWDVYDE